MGSRLKLTMALTLTGMAIWRLSPAAQGAEFPDPSVPVTSSEAQCSAAPASLWITVAGKGDCIRYYIGGAGSLDPDSNKKAVFYIHGDVMWGTQHDVVAPYGAATASSRQAVVDEAAKEFGMPVIMIARPGLYGSSGDHRKRRQAREMELVDAALKQLRARFKFTQIAITGQSGGGSVAAYLAAANPDSKCVVFTSAALSLAALRKAGQTDGYDYSHGLEIYNPVEHLDEMKKAAQGRRIFIIGDPKDEYALIANQIDYTEQARKAGLDLTFIESEGEEHHSLDSTGRHVAAWCLNNATTADIVKKVTSGAVRY